jgi:hypothetical protein
MQISNTIALVNSSEFIKLNIEERIKSVYSGKNIKLCKKEFLLQVEPTLGTSLCKQIKTISNARCKSFKYGLSL